jgi:hypothetical protein
VDLIQPVFCFGALASRTDMTPLPMHRGNRNEQWHLSLAGWF